MRIIDKRHDFYDCGQVGNTTDDLVYVRTERDERDTGIFYHSCTWRDNSIVYDFVSIGFCGKVYKGYRFRDSFDDEIYSKFLYNAEDIEELYKAQGWEYKPRRYWSQEKSFAEKYEKLEKENNSGKYAEIFEKYKTPIIVADREYNEPTSSGIRRGCICRINGLLNKYNFQTVFSPILAYQEISMFLGNMRKLERSVPEMSNNDKIFSKGFDKFSFRKPPTKKRKS